jgi:hypothetical protein
MDVHDASHLWLGIGFVRTAGVLGTSFWARRFVQLTPHALEWFYDAAHTSPAGSVALSGASLVLAKEALIEAGGARQLCLDLDWAGHEYLPLRFAVADGHDVVLVRARAPAALGAPTPRRRPPPPSHLNPPTSPSPLRRASRRRPRPSRRTCCASPT